MSNFVKRRRLDRRCKLSKMSPERVYRPTIESEVDTLMRHLRLEPERPITDALGDEENNYKTFARDQNGKRVFFKVCLLNQRPFEDGLQIFPPRGIENEIAVYKALAAVPSTETDLITPHFIAGHAGDLPWLLLDVIEPELLLTYEHQFTPSNLRSSWIETIIRGVAAYQSLAQYQPQLRRELPAFDTTNVSQFETFFDRNKEWLTQHLGNGKGTAARDYLIRGLSSWSKENTYLAHGDLSLHNIGFKDKALIVLDWEHAHISSPAYDFAKVFVQAWQYVDWQKEFAEAVYRWLPKEDHRALFGVAIVMRALAEIRYLEACLADKRYGYSRLLSRSLSRERMVAIFHRAIEAHEETIKSVLKQQT